jgi:hypothetical protein
METRTKAMARRVTNDASMRAIIREIDDKWRAFVRMCPQVNPDGVKLAVHRLIPESKFLFP